jgi:hypothetical protein
VKLFSNKSHLVANGDWTAYVKIGSSTDLRLQQHQQVEEGGEEEEEQLLFNGDDVSAAGAAGSTIHVSDTLAGPWRPLSPNTLGGSHITTYYYR